MVRLNYLCFLLLFALVSCSQKEAEPVKNSQKNIQSFSFTALNPVVNAAIDSVQHVITATLPIGTDVSKLIPTIVASSKAVVAPASGIAQDFSKPVSYTVTAENGTTQLYTVNITVRKSTAKSIKSFVFNGVPTSVTATIDSTKRTITAVFAAGTDLTKLTPTISVSDRAGISPASGSTQNFSKPVVYTVTAEDGSSQTFTATMKVLSVISDQAAQGKISAFKPFVVKNAVYRNEELFGQLGYSFKFSETEIACSPYVIVPVSFFIPKLEIGSFIGQGPYMYDETTKTSTSFLGARSLSIKLRPQR